MPDTLKLLPALAFGERNSVILHDLERYRVRIASFVPGLRSCDAAGQGAFQFKDVIAVTNGMSIASTATTPLHVHVEPSPVCVLQLVLAGSCTSIIEGKRHHCGAGTLVYLPDVERQTEAEMRSWLMLTVDRQRLLRVYEALSGRYPDVAAQGVLSRFHAIGPSPVTSRVMDKILAVIRIVDLSLHNPRALDMLALDDVLHRLTAMALWPELWAGETVSHGSAQAGFLKLRIMQEYIREHIGRPIHVTALAEHAGISTRFVHQIFLEHAGVTPAQWIKDLRLEEARRMLANRNLDIRIRHVASQFGFAKASLFTEHYRQRFGETPAATRSRLGIEAEATPS